MTTRPTAAVTPGLVWTRHRKDCEPAVTPVRREHAADGSWVPTSPSPESSHERSATGRCWRSPRDDALRSSAARRTSRPPRTRCPPQLRRLVLRVARLIQEPQGLPELATGVRVEVSRPVWLLLAPEPRQVRQRV